MRDSNSPPSLYYLTLSLLRQKNYYSFYLSHRPIFCTIIQILVHIVILLYSAAPASGTYWTDVEYVRSHTVYHSYYGYITIYEYNYMLHLNLYRDIQTYWAVGVQLGCNCLWDWTASLIQVSHYNQFLEDKPAGRKP